MAGCPKREPFLETVWHLVPFVIQLPSRFLVHLGSMFHIFVKHVPFILALAAQVGAR